MCRASTRLSANGLLCELLESVPVCFRSNTNGATSSRITPEEREFGRLKFMEPWLPALLWAEARRRAGAARIGCNATSKERSRCTNMVAKEWRLLNREWLGIAWSMGDDFKGEWWIKSRKRELKLGGRGEFGSGRGKVGERETRAMKFKLKCGDGNFTCTRNDKR